MSIETKLAAFDHVIFHLTNWYAEKKGNWQPNDLSRLKITKLLFFVTAVTASPGDQGLLSIFNSFAALPYGHVESDIQNHMESSTVYQVRKDALTFRNGTLAYTQSPHLSNDLAAQIESAVNTLKIKNDELVCYSAFDLVDLSHRWQSWKTIFFLAKQNGKLSMFIPSEMIMSEPKIFI